MNLPGDCGKSFLVQLSFLMPMQLLLKLGAVQDYSRRSNDLKMLKKCTFAWFKSLWCRHRKYLVCIKKSLNSELLILILVSNYWPYNFYITLNYNQNYKPTYKNLCLVYNIMKIMQSQSRCTMISFIVPLCVVICACNFDRSINIEIFSIYSISNLSVWKILEFNQRLHWL